MAREDDPEKLMASMPLADHPGNTANEPVSLLEDEETGDRLLIYTSADGVEVEFRYEGETLWMTQAQMADLFGRDVGSISRHIRNIFDERELDEETSLQKVQRSRGRPLTVYSLDVVISVGYRVSSKQATLFRKWATAKLVQFATKGFVVDVRRLKNAADADRIGELREIIGDIRASEKNVFREIKEICALCQDYDPSSQSARDFYSAMQNKLLWSICSKTAPELIFERADATQPNMGLQTWPNPNIRKSDATIAHNYLAEPEIREKNRLTVMLLDFFEDRLDLGKLTMMSDVNAELDRFMRFNDRAVLMGKGSISRLDADKKATEQYDLFAAQRRALRHQAED
jgi:hypothetical protein